jgi:hypothetical protein
MVPYYHLQAAESKRGLTLSQIHANIPGLGGRVMQMVKIIFSAFLLLSATKASAENAKKFDEVSYMLMLDTICIASNFDKSLIFQIRDIFCICKKAAC